MIFISHRGESMDAPENTLPAFKLALERGSDGMECDIHLTRDKVLVTIHDSSTARVGNKELIVEETDFADLQSVDVSNGKAGYCNVQIPKFSETLQYLGKDRLFYVEIKANDPDVIDAMVREIDAAGIDKKQIVMISFYEDIVRIYKERYPDRKALFLTACTAESNGTWGPTAAELIERLKNMKADGVDINGNPSFIKKEYVDAVKAAGFEFAVWTIDRKEIADLFIYYNVDAITSNCAANLKNCCK